MEPQELDDRLTAWWLEIAPTRQEELLMAEPPPMPWLAESLDHAGLRHGDIEHFLNRKRSELEATRDAGLNPRPDGAAEPTPRTTTAAPRSTVDE